jgi:hypothetical protein
MSALASWTADEDARLRALYGKVRAAEAARLIGRPTGGVYTRAFQLRLRSGWSRDFTRDEDRAIAIGWRRGLSIQTLALALDRKLITVYRRGRRLGFWFADPGRPAQSRRGRVAIDRLSMAEILALEPDALCPPGPVRGRGRPSTGVGR